MKKFLILMMVSVLTLTSMETNATNQIDTLNIVYEKQIDWCFYKGGMWYKDKDQAYARHILFDKYFMPEYHKSKIFQFEVKHAKLNKDIKFWRMASIVLAATIGGIVIVNIF